MRIQHNIMAMSAYRNYTNNVSAMKGNLEKLSSGYKINRAGDDAAGLAISEKMRAQITGLKQAQANAKSGINLVQTAEGALQEVQDMMNRMVKLAEQSANGTYDVNVDRNQLQKEFTQLKEEINRINQSANFNGINLFGGPDGATKTSDNEGIETYAETAKAPTVGTLTAGKDAGEGSFEAGEPQTGVSVTMSGPADISDWTSESAVDLTSATNPKVTATVGGKTYTVKLVATGSGEDNAAAADEVIVDANTKPKDLLGSVTSNLQAQIAAANTAGAAGNTTYTKVEDLTITANNSDKSKLDATVKTTAQTYKTGGEATAAKNTVTFTGLKAEDVIGDTVKVGTKTYEFVKAGGTAASGNTAIQVADTDDADAIATAFATEVKKDTDYVGNATAASGVVTVESKATGASAKMEITATDAAGEPEEKPTKVETKSTEVKATGVDFQDGTTKLTDANITTIKGLALKVGGEVDVNLSNITLTAGQNTGEDAAKVILNAAKDAVDEWNKANGDKKGYTYENLRISKTADGKGDGDIIAKLDAGDSVYLLADKTPKAAGATPIGSINIQIGDTNDDYNKMKINLYNISSAAITDISEGTGKVLDDLSVATEDAAGEALSALKGMVNYISDIRGELGAKQNRLTHTINNLSVMEENIQDAESTIRDTDVADEMMAYTKNNILIQSAQAMLAQANQVPQGVLQLLQ